MWSKEEAKTMRLEFWNGFKRYCYRNSIYRKWVLTGVKIKFTQLKFFVDRQKALVLFQIDHKNDLIRYEVYERFQAYRKLWTLECGEDLLWEEDFYEMEDKAVSAIYFKLDGVNLYRKDDWDKVYAFFAEKMPLLEEVYWEYRDLLTDTDINL